MKKTKKTGQSSDRSPRSFWERGQRCTSRRRAKTRLLTTNQGVPIADNQNSLKAGARGPVLLQDFILREKIMHFDHERIPERVVHARGSAAHGFFECLEPLGDITRAAFLQQKGDRIPVFTRFSTVAGNKGSFDLARDVRGFAVKFYTQEGNFDLVGNNIPVFFIQDAIKFPDLIHAAKQDPDREFPQAQTAHDTFWDFISLTPESMHMIMWIMSDRAIPRSYRMMEGFGVHTFRLVNAKGQSTFVKFHWRPKLGMQSVVWDEAVKINGADPDFHRRDLWNAIDQGDFPEFEFCLQTFTQRQADKFEFRRAGRDQDHPGGDDPAAGRRPHGAGPQPRPISSPKPSRSPSARPMWCRASISPMIPCCRAGCSPTRTPSSSGWAAPTSTRSRSTSPTARSTTCSATATCRWPCRQVRSITNRPALGPTSSMRARSAATRPLLRRRKASSCAFAPKALPITTARRGCSSPARPSRSRTTSSPPWCSSSANASCPASARPCLSRLIHIDEGLAMRVAAGLGVAEITPAELPVEPQDMKPSPALSILAKAVPTLQGRKVGCLVTDGTDDALLAGLRKAVEAAGATFEIVAPRIGGVTTAGGKLVPADHKVEGGPSVLFDAVAIIPSREGGAKLSTQAEAVNFLRDAFGHLKVIAYTPTAAPLLVKAGMPEANPDNDAGMISLDGSTPEDFVKAAAAGRIWDREPYVRDVP